MRAFRKIAIVIAAFAASLAAAPVSAATALYFEFSASTPTGTTLNHSGNFTLMDDGGTLSLYEINFQVGATMFDLTNTEFFQTPTGFQLGGTGSGLAGSTVGIDDFFLEYGANSLFAYTEEALFPAFAVDNDPIIVQQVDPRAVPEPGTWAMMLLGFGAMGWSFKRRRKLAFA